jgi:penicillin amidase
VPVRADDNDSLGLVPEPGWDARYDWAGYVPTMAMVTDPPAGFIATANNKTAPKDFPYVLTREWPEPFRQGRIASLLAATPKHSVASFEAIQRDAVDAYALVLKRLLIAAGPFDGKEKEAAALVDAWDGAMRRDLPQPLIYAAWARALAGRIYADELGKDFNSFWGHEPQFTLHVLNNVDGQADWCDDRATPAVEDCRSRIRLALHDALAELSDAYGADMRQWRWGAAHVALNTHRPLGNFPIIGGFFNREIEMDGGAFTIFRGDYAFGSKRPYGAFHGAGYRAIYDLGDPDRSVYIISTGESGNVFSDHYDDLMKLWAAGEYVTIPTSPQTVAAATKHTLTLEPKLNR